MESEILRPVRHMTPRRRLANGPLLNERTERLRNARTWDWYTIRNASGEGDQPAELWIYDEIGWFGTSATGFLSAVQGITARQINLRINSPGGEIFDGLAIYNLIRSHPANVTVTVDGLAASIASVIALAGNEVVMQPFSQMMIHDGSGVASGTAKDMRDMADLLDRMSDTIADVYQSRAGGGAKTWRKRMEAETWYSADEAVAAGLADRVAKPAAVEAAPDERLAARWDLRVFRYAGRDDAPTPTATAARTGETDDETEAPDPPVDAMVECEECGAMVPEEDLDEHMADEHGQGDENETVGEGGEEPEDRHTAVLAALARLRTDDARPFPAWDSNTVRQAIRSIADQSAPSPPPPPAPDPVTVEPCPSCAADKPIEDRVCPHCLHDPDAATGDPVAATVRETLATIAATAPAAPAPQAPEPTAGPPAAWNAAPERVEQTAPTDPWAVVGQSIAAAIKTEANRAPAPATPPQSAPEPLSPPSPDPVLLLRAIREETARCVQPSAPLGGGTP